MKWIHSANIACGGHAGDRQTIDTAVQLALENNVRIGAHPGLPDRLNFGRHVVPLEPGEFCELIHGQLHTLDESCARHGACLTHIKLHGALYHMVENDPMLRAAYIALVKRAWPGLVLVSIAGGFVSEAAANAGLRHWGEGFLDRGYFDATHLIPRQDANAILSTHEFAARLQLLQSTGLIASATGIVKVEARTWCIHGDNPDALEFARQARRTFDQMTP